MSNYHKKPPSNCMRLLAGRILLSRLRRLDDTITMPIQINGKRRAEIEVPKDMDKAEVEKAALSNDAVIRSLDGAQPKKVIVVPGRIVNVVV